MTFEKITISQLACEKKCTIEREDREREAISIEGGIEVDSQTVRACDIFISAILPKQKLCAREAAKEEVHHSNL